MRFFFRVQLVIRYAPAREIRFRRVPTGVGGIFKEGVTFANAPRSFKSGAKSHAAC